MKKKLMMVAVLLGALSLGACVDDNESASVTAIRNAKAAQLEALASYANAQAEAELILANAEAAIKAAQAAYEEAMAKLKDLEAQEKEIAVQKLQATLETDLAAAQAQAEADLATAQAELENQKANLIAAMDKVSDAEKKRVQELIAAADEVLTNKLQPARQDKLDATAAIARLQAELIGVEEYVKNQKAKYEKQIAGQEALIAEYGKYESYMKDKDSAEKAYQEADLALNPLWNTYSQKSAVYSQAQSAMYDKANEQSKYELIQKINDGSIPYNWYNIENIFDKDAQYINSYDVEYAYENGTVETVSWYVSLVNYVADADVIANDIDAANNEIKAATAAKSAADKALADKKAGAAYKAAAEAVDAAQKTYNEAKTEAEIQSAYAALQQAKNDLAAVTATEEDDVERAEKRLEDANEYLADLQAAEEVLTGEAASAYATYVADYKKAWEACYVTAYLDQQNAWNAYDLQSQLVSGLYNVANSYNVDYESLISGCKQQISTLKGWIAELNDVDDKNEAIAKEQEKLAAAEQAIAVYKAQYDDYMAQIEALIGSAEEAGE